MTDTHVQTGTATYRIVGSSPAHHDFVDKVKGSLLYAADLTLPGILHGKVVRSTVPSARILAIDTSHAHTVPGVVTVLTATDVPWNRVIARASGGLGELDVSMPVLASDRVRYLGEPIALVAARSRAAADEAADLVMIDYEELPGVFDPEQALAEDAPRVHDEGNVLVTWATGHGDADAAMAAADAVVRGTYYTQRVEHAYLEPEAGLGWIDTSGVLTLRVATQVIEHAAQIAAILDLPENKVRVISTYMGGGFGGKEDMTVEPYLALLVWATRRPVKMVWDRQESILASTKRHPFVMQYETGVRSDGTILAQRVDIVGDAGAYPYLSARVLFAAAAVAAGPYRAGVAAIKARAVFTNNVPASAFRGFGAMQVTFGYESQMDRIAATLGLSKEEVRLRNYLEKGDTLPTGETLTTAVALRETMRRALGALGEENEPGGPSKRVGRGFASNMQPYGRTMWFRDRASCWMSIEADGSLLIRTGVTDLGGGQAASLCQIASEILGVPLEEISIHIGDTHLTPLAGGTYATRQLYMSGNAVLRTATELREKLLPVAASALGTVPEKLRFEDGIVRDVDNDRGMRLAELVKACDEHGISPAHLCVWRAETGTFDPATGRGETFPDYTYGTHAAEVEVDVETGEVTVLKYAAAHDAGRAINPMRVEGQIQGGVYQGLGFALLEEIPLDEGNPASSLFATYFIPSSIDLPDVQPIIVESGEGKGPLGARGIGEPPVGPCAPAIASAIEDAVGVRLTRLPMTPERVLSALTTHTGQAEMTGGR